MYIINIILHIRIFKEVDDFEFNLIVNIKKLNNGIQISCQKVFEYIPHIEMFTIRKKSRFMFKNWNFAMFVSFRSPNVVQKRKTDGLSLSYWKTDR